MSVVLNVMLLDFLMTSLLTPSNKAGVPLCLAGDGVADPPVY